MDSTAVKWNELSRISEEEMKALMKEAVTKTYRLLLTLFDERSGGELILRLSKRDPAPQWDDPALE